MTVEAQELQRKQRELESLQQALVDREMEWSTAKREVYLFEEQYRVRVGEKYKELDRLKASVLALASKVFPEDDRIKNQAQSAWESMHQADDSESRPGAESTASEMVPKPTDELKKLFRRAARHMHPDFTTDGKERVRRNELMARLNQAYRESDVDRVRDLLNEFEAHKPFEEHEGPGKKLSRVLKQIGQVRHRLFQIETDFRQLEQSDLYRLHQYHKQQEFGTDVLADMASEVDEQIQTVRNRIRNLASDCAQL